MDDSDNNVLLDPVSYFNSSPVELRNQPSPQRIHIIIDPFDIQLHNHVIFKIYVSLEFHCQISKVKMIFIATSISNTPIFKFYKSSPPINMVPVCILTKLIMSTKAL